MLFFYTIAEDSRNTPVNFQMNEAVILISLAWKINKMKTK
jgi:hypothetical protein